MSSLRALVTGVSGQDGSYLAELLHSKGYSVFGLMRRQSNPNLANISHLVDQIEIVEGDLTDQGSLNAAVKAARPDEVYSLGAQSFVAASFTQPELTGNVTGLGVLRLLEAVRHYAPKARFYQASSSEMFGKVRETPQNENTAFYPRSPYGVAKLYAHWAVVNYREAYKMHASSGILFNHESERRGLEFVTRKITDGVARIKHGMQRTIKLGDLSPRRDWGYAPDYVDLMWRMLQQDEPGDYIGATGEQHSVRDFVEAAFRAAGIRQWEAYVEVDPKLGRPSEVNTLCGDATKAKEKLGWTPTTGFEDLVKRMVDYDSERFKRR